MNLKHKDPEINTDNPFANCKLGREKYAEILTSIVETYADGFVLALDGKWGTGKSTFVKMWDASLRKAEFQTIYFNAWEHDFENEPLVALIGEMRKLVDKEDNKTDFNSLLKKGAVLSKKILPSVVKAFAKRHLGDEATEILSDSVGAISDIFEEEVYEYVNKKDGLEEFKKELVQYIEKYNNSKPVVFIIDELDRCRPDYAVEILEKIKHFFTVEGIVFVLSIDKIQLGHSIQGYYGSDKIDTNEYLRRFIDLEYQLPEPNIKEFVYYLYKYYGFNEFFDEGERRRHPMFEREGERFIGFAIKLFSKYNYTLRQQEKIFAFTRIVLRLFTSHSFVFPHLFMLLIHLKGREFEFYSGLKNKTFSIQELVDQYESIFLIYLIEEFDGDYNKEFISTEALLISFYNNSLQQNSLIKKYIPELTIVKDGKENIGFKTNINKDKYDENLAKFIKSGENTEFYRYDLKHLLERIELLLPLN